MDLTLHALVDHGRVPAERLETFLRDASAGGVSVIQLREKDVAIREALRYGQRARSIARDLGMLFAVDDRLDLALALDADILHLGQEDLPPEVARRIAPGLSLGLSASNLTELDQALAASPAYIGFGPIFTTASKADSARTTGPRRLAEAVRRAGDCPIVAIGGITRGNAQEVWRAGASGIAVIAALVEASDVRRAAGALRERTGREGDPHVP